MALAAEYLGLGEAALQDIVRDVARENPIVREHFSDDLSKRLLDRVKKAKAGRRALDVVECLTMAQENRLIRAYPEFELVFCRTGVNGHAKWAASRRLAFEVLLAKFRVEFDQKRQWVTDIGANFSAHFSSDRGYVHSNSPVMSGNDPQRFTERYMTIVKRSQTMTTVTEYQQAFLREIKKIVDSPIVNMRECSFSSLCTVPIARCRCATPYAILLHSNYDIPLQDLADAFVVKGVVEAYGCFMYHSDILLKEEGYFPCGSVHFSKADGKIRFRFVEDASFNYEHDWENYQSYLYTSVFTDRAKTAVFFLELLENRDGEQFFKIVKSLVPIQKITPGVVSHALWYEGAETKTVVTYPEFLETDGQNFNIGRAVDYAIFNRGAPYKQCRMVVDRDFVNKGLEYAYRATTEKFKPVDIFSYLQANNRTWIVGGKEIMQAPRIADANQLMILSNAIFLAAYTIKYDMGKSLQRRIHEIEYNRWLLNASIIKKIFARYSSVGLMDDYAHGGRGHLGFVWRIIGAAHWYLYQQKRVGISTAEAIRDCVRFQDVSDVLNYDFFRRMVDKFNPPSDEPWPIPPVADASDKTHGDFRKLIAEKSRAVVDSLLDSGNESGSDSGESTVGYDPCEYDGETLSVERVDGAGMCLPEAFLRATRMEVEMREFVCVLRCAGLKMRHPSTTAISYDFKNDRVTNNTMPLDLVEILAGLFKVKILVHSVVAGITKSYGTGPVVHLYHTAGHIDAMTPSAHLVYDPALHDSVRTALCATRVDNAGRHDCTATLVREDVPGDGDCFYSALIRADVRGRLPETPALIREALAPIMGAAVAPGVWADRDVIAALAEKYDVAVCVHVARPACCELIGAGGYVLHVAFDPGSAHYSALVQPVDSAITYENIDSRASVLQQHLKTFAPLYGVQAMDAREAYNLNFKDKTKLLANISDSVARTSMSINRSGAKLLEMLNVFHLDVESQRVLDVGGAPGGFYQILSARGAIVTTVSHPRIKYSPAVATEHLRYIDVTTETLPTGVYPVVTVDVATDACFTDAKLTSTVLERVLPKVAPGGALLIKLPDASIFPSDRFARARERFELCDVYKPVASPFGSSEVYVVFRGRGVRGDNLIRDWSMWRAAAGLLLYEKARTSGRPLKRFSPTHLERIVAADSPMNIVDVDNRRVLDDPTRFAVLVRLYAERFPADPPLAVSSELHYPRVVDPAEACESSQCCVWFELPTLNYPIMIARRPHVSAVDRSYIYHSGLAIHATYDDGDLVDDEEAMSRVRVPDRQLKELMAAVMPRKDVYPSFGDCTLSPLSNLAFVRNYVRHMNFETYSIVVRDSKIHLAASHTSVKFSDAEKCSRFAALVRMHSVRGKFERTTEPYYSYETNSIECCTPDSLGLTSIVYVHQAVPAQRSIVMTLGKVDRVFEEGATVVVEFTDRAEGVNVQLARDLRQRYSPTTTLCVQYDDSVVSDTIVVAAFSQLAGVLYLLRNSNFDLLDGALTKGSILTDTQQVYQRAKQELRSLWECEELAARNNLRGAYQRYESNPGDHMVFSDVSIGVYDTRESKWTVRPNVQARAYEYCYDGESLVPFSTEMTSRRGFVMVNKDTIFMSGLSLLRSVPDGYTEINAEVLVRSGAPGSGKSREILTLSDKTAGRDIVLTTTNQAAKDLRARAPAAGHALTERQLLTKFRTIDSYLMHGRDTCHTLWVDEIYMEHPGKIVEAMQKSGCQRAIFYGDSAQIPFINRHRLNTLRFNDFKLFGWRVHPRTHTYRCPRDVVALINVMHMYPFVITGSNPVVSSLTVKYIHTVGEIAVARDRLIMTYTQSEKETLRREGFTNVVTVHEYQGQQVADAVLVRLQTKMVEVFSSRNHILVALTRHTRSLVYYTVKNDETVKNIEKAATLSSVECYREADQVGDSWRSVEQRLHYADVQTKYELNEPRLYRSIVFTNFNESYTPRRFVVEPTIPEFYRESDMESPTVPADLGFLQETYERIFPHHSFVERRYETLDAELGDVILAECEFALRSRAFNFLRFRPDDYLQPCLATAIQPRVGLTPQQICYAYSERNGGPPDFEQSLPVDTLVETAYQRFVDTYLRGGDLVRQFRFDQLSVNSTDIVDWMDGQTGDVKKILEQKSHMLKDYDMTKYYLALKANAKPVLDGTAIARITAPQTIAFLDKLVNCIFCPLVRVIKNRLLAVLKPDFIINSDMSNEEFEDLLSARLPPSRMMHMGFALELDASKYDKSQGMRAMHMELTFLREFGMPEWLLDWWVYSRVHTTLIDFVTGFKGRVVYQRKSGDPMTFLGNTVFLMMALAYVYDLRDCCGVFAGDDSFVWMRKPQRNIEAAEDFSMIFNLEMKTIEKRTPYFCSKFLIPITDREWRVVPDLAKLLTKLGRRDLVSREHAEEYRVSTLDNLKSLRDIRVARGVSMCLLDRYGVSVDAELLISTLLRYLSDSEQFRQLYQEPPGFVPRVFTKLPTLDI